MDSLAEALRRGRMDETSAILFAKHFSHVEIKDEPAEEMVPGVAVPRHFVLQPVWKGVDRPVVGGWSVGTDLKLAGRLQRAVESGKVFCMIQFLTDKYEQTYIGATAMILGRKMNADLKRLGF